MKRGKGATLYSDGLLGLRGDDRRFHEAAAILSDTERDMLQHAVHNKIGVVLSVQKTIGNFSARNENDYHYLLNTAALQLGRAMCRIFM